MDGSDFPKLGTEVGGGSPAVLRLAGEGGQLPGGDVPGLRQPARTGIGGQGAVSASLRPGPVCGGGCAQGAAELPVPWSCWSGPWGWATSRPDGLPGNAFRRPFGSPCPGDSVLDVPGSTRSGGVGLDHIRAPPQAQAHGQRRMEQRSGLPEAWREITVAQGSQGPRSYMFCAQAGNPEGQAGPGGMGRRPPKLGRQQPRYYLGRGTDPETEVAVQKGVRDRRACEYETRRSPHSYHGGEKMPRITRPQVYRVVREMLPGNGSDRRSCCCGWRIRSATSGRAAETPLRPP